MALTIDGLEKWYVNTVKMGYAFAGETPPEPIPLPDVTTIDGLLEGIVGASEDARLAAAIANGYENNTVQKAYVYQLPDKLWEWVGIKTVGGESVYDAGTVTFAKVTEIISKDADGNVLQTYTVPDEIQALTGYGWGAGDTCNYIDFEHKKFVQCLDRVNINTLSFTRNSAGNGYASMPANSKGAVAGGIDAVAEKLPISRVETYAEFNDLDMVCTVNNKGYSSTRYFLARNTDCASASDYSDFFGDAYVYYALTTPVETDISAYLDGDVITEVAPGGTITFVNEDGIAVPVLIDYVGK